MAAVQYYIIGVHYDHHHRISRVRILQNGNSFEESKAFVMLSLTSGHLIKTAYHTKNSGFQAGMQVIQIKIDDECYLKTEANNIKEDNLGELPEF